MKAAVTDVLVLDASIAAAWFLPDEQRDAADRLMAEIRSTVGFVPTLFWFETRNLFLVAERRGRLRPGEPLLLMTQLRGLPLEDAVSGGDGLVLELAARNTLTAYDESYVALARMQGLPLATGTGTETWPSPPAVRGSPWLGHSNMSTELSVSGNDVLKRAEELDARCHAALRPARPTRRTSDR